MNRIVLAILFLFLCLYSPGVSAQQNCSPDYLAELLQLEDFVGSPVGEAITTVGDDPTLDELSDSYQDVSQLRIEIEDAWDDIVDCSAAHRDVVINYLQLVAGTEDVLVLKMLEINGAISSDIYNERAEPLAERISERLDAVMAYVTPEQ